MNNNKLHKLNAIKCQIRKIYTIKEEGNMK